MVEYKKPCRRAPSSIDCDTIFYGTTHDKFLINPLTKSYQTAANMSGAQEMPKLLKESVENSKAEYVSLGKSGLRISIPILGAMSIGHPEWAPWVIDEEKVCQIPNPMFRKLLMKVVTSSA